LILSSIRPSLQTISVLLVLFPMTLVFSSI
jgi:hypothetical protein